jgi:type I restriction enzyme R subunit
MSEIDKHSEEIHFRNCLVPKRAEASRLDRQLEAAGWVVQDKKDLNLFAGPGIAVREVVMKPGHGRIDYLLYVDKAVGGLPRIRSKGVAEM